MPCYDSRNAPENVAKETREACMKEFMHNSPVAEMLCNTIHMLKKKQREQLSPQILHWWSEHQARDEGREPEKQRDGDGDLLVSFGDMRSFTLDSLKEIMGGKVDDNHEGMVEEHLLAFNYAVSQGIHPGQALFACVQAIGLLIGYAIRSGMHPSVGAAMTALMIKATQEGAKNVQIITTN